MDQLLVLRGLAASGEQARRLLLAGKVRLDGSAAPKPGTKVPEDASVEVIEAERYVSRGGLKLEAALQEFGIGVAGKVCLDVGASTGGFTDCLLQHGATLVHAWDVGHGQLHWKLRSDPRVIVREGFNVRHVCANDVPHDVRLVVADVSFISLLLILEPLFAILREKVEFIVLIKPQFELAREDVGKGGIVRDPELHRKAVEKVRAFVESAPVLQWRGVIESPITGADGNREFLASFCKK